MVEVIQIWACVAGVQVKQLYGNLCTRLHWWTFKALVHADIKPPTHQTTNVVMYQFKKCSFHTLDATIVRHEYVLAVTSCLAAFRLGERSGAVLQICI